MRSKSFKDGKIMSVLKVVFIAFFIQSGVLHAQLSDTQVKNAVNAAGGPERMIKAIAENMSKRIPLMLDDITQLSAVAASSKTYTQFYELLTEDESLVRNISSQLRQIKSDTSRQLCSSSTPKVLITEYDASYKYVYRHKGKVVLSFDITKRDC